MSADFFYAVRKHIFVLCRAACGRGGRGLLTSLMEEWRYYKLNFEEARSFMRGRTFLSLPSVSGGEDTFPNLSENPK